MAVTLNNTARHAALDALADLCDGATLTVRTGAAPGAGNIATGTVLATITLPTPAFAAASGGTVARTGTWEDASAENTGTAAHFRIVCTGGAIFEGTVTATSGGGDLEVANTSFTSGNPFAITAFTMSFTNG
jgi:hypothetical protein